MSMLCSICKICCSPVIPPPMEAQPYVGKWVMEVTGRENPAVFIIYNDGYFRYTEFVNMMQVVKEGGITHWDIDEHQAALFSEGLCTKAQSFYLTKPEADQNGYIIMRMDGMKYRKKVEGIIKSVQERDAEVGKIKAGSDDEDDVPLEDEVDSKFPVEISI